MLTPSLTLRPLTETYKKRARMIQRRESCYEWLPVPVNTEEGEEVPRPVSSLTGGLSRMAEFSRGPEGEVYDLEHEGDVPPKGGGARDGKPINGCVSPGTLSHEGWESKP